MEIFLIIWIYNFSLFSILPLRTLVTSFVPRIEIFWKMIVRNDVKWGEIFSGTISAMKISAQSWNVCLYRRLKLANSGEGWFDSIVK